MSKSCFSFVSPQIHGKHFVKIQSGKNKEKSEKVDFQSATFFLFEDAVLCVHGPLSFLDLLEIVRSLSF